MKTRLRIVSPVEKGLLPVFLAFILFCLPDARAQGPTLTSMSPNAATAGSDTFLLIITGTEFGADSIVYWNGANRVTSFVSSTKVTAQILSSDIASAGAANVTVSDSSGTSGPLPFTISNGIVPTIGALLPSSAIAGSSGLNLTLTGFGFDSTSVVEWNGSSRTTNFFSSGTLEALISSSDLAVGGNMDVRVVTGSLISNTLVFTVSISTPPPVISNLSPNRIVAGAADFTLLVTGSNFSETCVVLWNGFTRNTSFVSDTLLQATIPASDVEVTGSIPITVRETAPGGGDSGAVFFTISPFSTLYFPHVPVGGGYVIIFTLTNTGGDAASGTLRLTDQSGSPFSVNLSDISTGQAIPLGVHSSLDITIPSGATRRYVASALNSSDPTTSGWARVETTGGRLDGVGTFQFRDSFGILRTVAGVLAAEPLSVATIPVDNDESQNRYTGFAIANTSDSNINIQVVTLDADGALQDVIDPPELNPLGPRQQKARFLHEYLPARQTFKGSMILVVQGSEKAVVVALDDFFTQNLLTVLPVIRSKAPNVPD